MKLIKNIIPFTFLLFISVHLVLFLVLQKDPIDFVQNRENSLIPSYDKSGTTVYFKKWYRYIEDHFPLKNEYIKQSTVRIRMEYVKRETSNADITVKVILGFNAAPNTRK